MRQRYSCFTRALQRGVLDPDLPAHRFPARPGSHVYLISCFVDSSTYAFGHELMGRYGCAATQVCVCGVL